MNSDVGTARGDGGIVDSVLGLGGLILEQPTNVTRICRAIKGSTRKNTADGSQEIKQITCYQAGIGTADLQSKVEGGLTGEGEAGLAEHIREAYQFIAANYSSESNDEIILVGFSRGAFTARSVAAFINDIGLLTPKGMTFFYPIFEDWENQQKMLTQPYQPSFPKYPFPEPRPHMYPDPTEYRNKLVQLGYTRPSIRIKAVAVYDTVGKFNFLRLLMSNTKIDISIKALSAFHVSPFGKTSLHQNILSISPLSTQQCLHALTMPYMLSLSMNFVRHSPQPCGKIPRMARP